MCTALIPDTSRSFFFFFFNDTATTEIYTLSLHDALPISLARDLHVVAEMPREVVGQLLWPAIDLPPPEDVEAVMVEQKQAARRSEEHTSELQSRLHLVCRLLLEKKKKNTAVRSECAHGHH